MKSPARLDLIIERKSKRDAFALATRRECSVGRLFELLIAAEKLRTDGEVHVPPTMPGLRAKTS